jgi:hypothetical protein
VVEVHVKIVKKSISILIDHRSIHSYIAPKIVDTCILHKRKKKKAWLVHLDTGLKRKVSELIEDYPVEMNGLLTRVNLNILPLGSYDALIGMDWLTTHKVKFGFYNKTFDCIDDEGNPILVKDTLRTISIRQIPSLQLKRSARKGFQLYSVHVLESTKNKESNIEYYPRLQEFKDVFPEEIPGIPPKRDIDFSIDLMSGFAPISRDLYRMSTPELMELKMQMKDLLDKGYIIPSVSP